MGKGIHEGTKQPCSILEYTICAILVRHIACAKRHHVFVICIVAICRAYPTKSLKSCMEISEMPTPAFEKCRFLFGVFFCKTVCSPISTII